LNYLEDVEVVKLENRVRLTHHNHFSDAIEEANEGRDTATEIEEESRLPDVGLPGVDLLYWEYGNTHRVR
jgi:hypothetical protein